MTSYTIKEIKKIVDRSEQSIYSFMRTDPTFFEEHRIKAQKGGYRYDEIAVERIREHYNLKNNPLMENDLPPQDLFPTADQTPITISPAIDEEKIALSAELEDLRGKYEALQANFDRVNGEIVKMERENALKNEEIQRLLLIIQQEKQEKQQIMLMLPQPRKSIGERIRNLFRKKDEG